MKLLQCIESMGGCGDVVRIYQHVRTCRCGRSVANYETDATVCTRGPCVVIALDSVEIETGSRGKWHVSSDVVRP